MRDYSIVSAKFWIGETGKRLRGNRDAQLLALYLITSPHSSMSGLYYCPAAYMAQDLGIPLEGARKGLDTLVDRGFCEYDEDAEMVFVVQMARFQIGATLARSDNRRAGLLKELAKLPKTPLIRRFFEVYAGAYALDERDLPLPPLRTSEGAPEPLPSQDQDQEQEQEPDDDGAAAPAPAPLRLDLGDGLSEPPEAPTFSSEGFSDRQREALDALGEIPFHVVRWKRPEGTVAEVIGRIKAHELARDLGGDGFPRIPVRQTIAQAASWTRANPTKAKTPGGLRRFIVDWFVREQNRGGSRPVDSGGLAQRRGGDLLAKVNRATEER